MHHNFNVKMTTRRDKSTNDNNNNNNLLIFIPPLGHLACLRNQPQTTRTRNLDTNYLTGIHTLFTLKSSETMFSQDKT